MTPLSAADAPAMAALHQASFAASWTAEAFAELLRAGAGGYGIIAKGQLTAMLLARCAADEVEILTLAAHPTARRQGLASQLLQQLKRDHPHSKIFLETRITNHPAQQLYHRHGFRKIGQRKGYYHEPDGARVDAVVMGWIAPQS